MTDLKVTFPRSIQYMRTVACFCGLFTEAKRHSNFDRPPRYVFFVVLSKVERECCLLKRGTVLSYLCRSGKSASRSSPRQSQLHPEFSGFV